MHAVASFILGFFIGEHENWNIASMLYVNKNIGTPAEI